MNAESLHEEWNDLFYRTYNHLLENGYFDPSSSKETIMDQLLLGAQFLRLQKLRKHTARLTFSQFACFLISFIFIKVN